MAKLTSRARKALPTQDFAVPGRRYPINDASHARNALARVAQHGSPREKAEVRAKVHRDYPSIKETSMKTEKRSHKSPTEGLHERGHHESHRGEAKPMSHKEFEKLDHGGSHDHMKYRGK